MIQAHFCAKALKLFPFIKENIKTKITTESKGTKCQKSNPFSPRKPKASTPSPAVLASNQADSTSMDPPKVAKPPLPSFLPNLSSTPSTSTAPTLESPPIASNPKSSKASQKKSLISLSLIIISPSSPCLISKISSSSHTSPPAPSPCLRASPPSSSCP